MLKLTRIDAAAEAAAAHAAACRRCSMPIIDPEGNPGLYGEACPAGLRLLVGYAAALGLPVPAWVRTRSGS